MNMQGPSGHPYWLKINCCQPHTALPFQHAAIWEGGGGRPCELLSSKGCELSCSENASLLSTVHEFPAAGLCWTQFGALGGQRGGGVQPIWVCSCPVSVIVAGVTLAKVPTT